MKTIIFLVKVVLILSLLFCTLLLSYTIPIINYSVSFVLFFLMYLIILTRVNVIRENESDRGLYFTLKISTKAKTLDDMSKFNLIDTNVSEHMKQMTEDKSKDLYEITKVPAKYLGRAENPVITDVYRIVDGKIYIKSFGRSQYQELVLGLEVIDISDSVPNDEYAKIGIVKECSDWHNVLVDFGNNETSLYCLIKDCQEDYTVEGHGTTKINYYDDSLRAFF